RQTLEAAALLLCIGVLGTAVFDGLFPWRDRHYPLEFLCAPLLLWAAFRFEPREAATAVLVLSGVAIAGTLAGFGPFARPTYDESLLLLQAFTGVTAIMTLVLAAAVAERREAEERLRRLAVSDPLTGLSNYRQLVLALETEIKRSSRTDRSFAVVLMDLDGLKTINDRFGHLVGSLALRRVAETLLGSCRGIDTAARLGGDEFALVLPETGDAAAWHVAGRVAERAARGGWYPVLGAAGHAVVLDVRGMPVSVQESYLELTFARPTRWSIVAGAANAVMMPESWGAWYAVCPSCSAREPVSQLTGTMVCPR